MSNFSFLLHEFESLQLEAKKSEANIFCEPEISAIYSRKALENTLKHVYTVDEDLDATLLDDVKSNLNTYLTNYDFKQIIPKEYLDELHFIRKIGNLAAHESQTNIDSKQSLYANQCLYKFMLWVVEVYSEYETPKEYIVQKELKAKKEQKEELISSNINEEKILEENKKLLEKLALLQEALEKQTKEEKQNKKQKVIKVKDIDEKTTRENLIDLELEEAGFDVNFFKHGKDIEYKLVLEDGSFGYADYVIWDSDDTPIAVIEAKRASADITKGKHQAKVYAKALKEKFKKEVLVFVTNGRVIEYTNGFYPFRAIHSFFPKSEMLWYLKKLEKLKNVKPSSLEVKNSITNRRYQKQMIKSVFESYEAHQTRALLVMATGSGKTRVSASISDILISAGWAKKILFLADRKELVKQARKNFDEYLEETTVNLIEEKDLQNRLHFSTYETLHNLIEKGKYNSAFFDLIIVDEAHRTIYKKYKAIFEYFDSLVLGLTATPADEVHRNTYEFFNTQDENPTDAYALQTAIDDGYLINFKPFEIDLGIVKRGIKYKDLTSQEKEEFEDKFDEEFAEDTEDAFKNIESKEINKRIFNKQTNEKVLEYLFKYGLKTHDGNQIGKTIIFAKNQEHAKYIKEVFDLKYPKSQEIAQIIHSEISHVDSLIDEFKKPKSNLKIAISVDMLDTGIDVPEILNLVFFKAVKSKIKFWQMIGRGTRLCPDIFAQGKDKEYFNIFDFCQNFSFFDMKSEGLKAQDNKSLKQRLFLKRVKIIMKCEDKDFQEDLANTVKSQIRNLDSKAYYVKKHRHIIEELQEKEFSFISDDMYTKIKDISEYIEDTNDFEVQRFQMLVLNTQENIIDEKDNTKNLKELNQRVKRLKAHAVNKIEEVIKKEELIDDILLKKIELSSIGSLQTVKNELEHLANLTLSKKEEPKKTNFSDKVEDVKELYSKDFIKHADVKTDIQKELDKFIESLYSLELLDESSLITISDIDKIRTLVFDTQKNLQDKLDDDISFEQMITKIINTSSKEIANTILDNFVNQDNYSKKQIELMNKIKNIVFEKQYINIKDSVINASQLLFNDNHALSSDFNSLEQDEKDDVLSVINLIKKVEYNIL